MSITAGPSGRTYRDCGKGGRAISCEFLAPSRVFTSANLMVNHFRTEFSEVRALRPPQDVPVAVIIAGAKTWPGISEDARIALLHLQIKHQSEWTQASPKGLLVVPSKARHFLFNDEPALVVGAITYVVRNAQQRPR